DKHIRFHRLVSDHRVFERSDGGRLVCIRNVTSCFGESRPRQPAEALFAIMVLRLRDVTRGASDPLVQQIRFQHDRPPSVREHGRILRTAVRFGCPANELIADRAILELPLRTADRRLGAILDRYAEEIVARLPAADTFLDNVRRAVAQSLRGAEPTLQLAAQRLRLSKRTLQRKLQLVGTSHFELLERARHELTLRYLEDPALTIAEVAFLLGFANLGSFYRSFRRWTASTPAEYRTMRTVH